MRTGERRWHFQTSHHPLWDYDIPTAPILVDAVKDGRTIKALAQATKQGLLFVLNRETGEPIWPIPEVAVPQGNVPGEWYSPTQPIPPLRYGHQGIEIDDLIDFTPAVARRGRARRRESPDRARSTRRPCRSIRTGRLSTLMVMGGSNWPGGSYDPESAHRLRHRERRREQHDDLPLRGRLGDAARHLPRSRRGRVRRRAQSSSVQGLPLLKPPYGTIAAFDLTKGEMLWEIPNGETPDNDPQSSRAARSRTSAARAARGSRRARSRRRRC